VLAYCGLRNVDFFSSFGETQPSGDGIKNGKSEIKHSTKITIEKWKPCNAAKLRIADEKYTDQPLFYSIDFSRLSAISLSPNCLFCSSC